jgi:hypothetical protein
VIIVDETPIGEIKKKLLGSSVYVLGLNDEYQIDKGIVRSFKVDGGGLFCNIEQCHTGSVFERSIFDFFQTEEEAKEMVVHNLQKLIDNMDNIPIRGEE